MGSLSDRRSPGTACPRVEVWERRRQCAKVECLGKKASWSPLRFCWGGIQPPPPRLNRGGNNGRSPYQHLEGGAVRGMNPDISIMVCKYHSVTAFRSAARAAPPSSSRAGRGAGAAVGALPHGDEGLVEAVQEVPGPRVRHLHVPREQVLRGHRWDPPDPGGGDTAEGSGGGDTRGGRRSGDEGREDPPGRRGKGALTSSYAYSLVLVLPN